MNNIKTEIFSGLIGASFGAVLTFLGLWGNFLNSAFERDQRSIEVILEISNSWEEHFKDDTRRRFIRFINVLGDLEGEHNKKTRDNLLKAFADESNLSIEPSNLLISIEPNNLLKPFADESNVSIEFNIYGSSNNLIQLDDTLLNLLELRQDNIGEQNFYEELSKKISLYRTSLIRTLNMLEAVALIREKSDSHEVKEIIDYMYLGAIKKRCKQLKEFVKEYNRIKYNEIKDDKNRNYKAWRILYDGTFPNCTIWPEYKEREWWFMPILSVFLSFMPILSVFLSVIVICFFLRVIARRVQLFLNPRI